MTCQVIVFKARSKCNDPRAESSQPRNIYISVIGELVLFPSPGRWRHWKCDVTLTQAKDPKCQASERNRYFP